MASKGLAGSTDFFRFAGRINQEQFMRLSTPLRAARVGNPRAVPECGWFARSLRIAGC